MKKILVLSLVMFMAGFYANAQHFIKEQVTYIYDYYVVVYFKDKVGTPYSVDKPNEFLGPKAIERRKKYNIPVTKQDLPVNPAYVKQLEDAGVKVIKTSKWLNCAIISVRDTSIMKDIRALDFVIDKPPAAPKNYSPEVLKKAKVRNNDKFEPKVYDYGLGTNQVTMLNVHELHNMGFDGRGVTMAILDGGFYKVNKLPAFDSLWKNNQILGWYDFVDMDTTVFDDGTHGMMVLSTIGGNMKDFVGTAPKASFWLFVTEDGSSETVLEEYNYVIACEKADSIGVDIIHSSLGYSDFDVYETDYTYDDLDGNTAISSIGADIAASKGIIVTTSAGNEGDEPWTYISAPADADSVLAVGAVTRTGTYASFSSLGPSNDGRIKPDVTAQGYSVYVQGTKGLEVASGTSFSGPIIAGAVACLFQAFPNMTNMEIYDAVKANGSNAKEPDDHLGYGIPNFYKAYLYLDKKQKDK